MRLFVAIELDDEARDRLSAEQNRLKKTLASDARSSLKWVRPEHMHLTLAFLGEIPDERVTDVAAEISRPIDATRFAASFGELGVFPDRGAPRVLWLGVTQGTAEVVSVQREVAARVIRLGIGLERRAFHPHLTLARWHTSRPHDRRRVAAAARHQTVARIRVDCVSLMMSRLSPSGPTYMLLARSPLAEDRRPPLQSA